MKLIKPLSLFEIATLVNGDYYGNKDHLITGLNEIHRVEKGDLIFVDHPKYYSKALTSSASTILIDRKVDFPTGKAIIVCSNPFDQFNFLMNEFFPFQPSVLSISKTAQIGENTHIQPHTFIGNNVVIGRDCIIHSNVSIYDNTKIGDGVIIHSGSVIGADAFYFQKREKGYKKLTSVGCVVLKDYVEVGSNCTIDKGVCAETILGQGTKLDSQVHIGHDTIIGENCLLAAHVGISGAAVIKDNVTLWGQVGVASNVVIGEGAVVLGQSGVTKSLQGHITYFGTPAIDNRKKLKELALIRRLPKLYESL